MNYGQEVRDTDEHLKRLTEKQNISCDSHSFFENFYEKSVFVAANYGSASIWIYFVGQCADVR